jgi:ABC-type transporter Mla MlaB component
VQRGRPSLETRGPTEAAAQESIAHSSHEPHAAGTSCATSVPDMSVGTHACVYYQKADERARMLSDFFGNGVASGQKLLCYCPPGQQDDLWPGATALIERGQLMVGSADVRYFADGHFRGALPQSALDALQASAAAEGYTGVRVYADCGWVLSRLADPTQWVDYELWATGAVMGTNIVGLCGYQTTIQPHEERKQDTVYKQDTVLKQVTVCKQDAVLKQDAVKQIDALHPAVLGERVNSYWLSRTAEGVALCGEVDRFCAGQVRDLLRRALANEAGLDLSGLRFIDSAGVCAVQQAIEGLPHSSLRNVPPLFARIWALLSA